MNYRNRLLLFLLVISVSCTVYKEYPVDVFRPGAIDIPVDVVNVALVSRNFKYPGDTLLNYYRNNNRLVRVKNDPANLDSILAMACLNALSDNLKEKTALKSVKILPYEVFRHHTGAKLPKLDMEVAEKLTSATETDLLISLETFSSFYSSYPESYESVDASEVITVAVWGVYDPFTKKMLDHKSLIDTVVWHAYDDQGNYQRDYRSPPRLDALKIAAAMAGETYAKRFYASWQTEMREYSVPPIADFSLAASYFEDKKYDEAVNIWQQYADKRNGRMAVNARFNLALAYEIKDNPELALKWLNSARELAVPYRNREELAKIDDYRKILMRRIKELNQLRQQ